MSEPKKLFFKQSALSSVADKMWSASKEEYKTSDKISSVALETRSLDSVLAAKKAEAEAERSERAETAKKCTFIFGSKIADRVIPPPASNGTTTGFSQDEKSKSADELIRESSAASTSAFDNNDANFREKVVIEADKKKEDQVKKPERIEVTTGEEDEVNIFHCQCKLHEFEKEQKTWAERGKNTLRVNKCVDDDGVTHLRIVARAQGTQRVVLNSRVTADTVLELVDEKRLRLSATTPDDLLLPHMFLKTEGCVADLVKILQRAKADDEERRKRKRKNEESLDSEAKKERVEKKEKPSPEELEKGEPVPETHLVEA